MRNLFFSFSKKTFCRIKKNLNTIKLLFKHRKAVVKNLFRFLLKTRPGKTILGVFVVLLFGIIPYLFFTASETEAAWWNETWSYRKAIAVANTSGSTLTDFQVKVLANQDLSADITAGKIQSDLDDLRFTAQNGEPLNYWIEDSTAASVDVWVKIPNIPTGGATIFMYYGNASAVSVQNGDGVFEFFDGFDDGDVSNWSKESSTISAQSVDGNQGLNITPGGSNYKDTEVYKTVSLPASYTVESRIKDIGTGQYPGGLIITYQDINNWIALEGSATQWTERGENGGVDTNWIHAFTPNIIPTGWQKQRIDIPNDGNYKVFINDVLQATKALPYSFTRNGIGFSKHIGQGDIFSDWIFVRKYASADPTLTISSTEEKSPAPVGYWKFDEGTGTTTQDASGKNNNGTLTNMSATPSPTSGWQTEDQCVSGKCLAFDGTDDYVNIAHNNSMNFIPNGGQTISAWVYNTDSGNNRHTIYSKRDNSGDYKGCYLRYELSPTNVQFSCRYNSSIAPAVTANVGAVNQWHYVVGIVGDGLLRLYSDGKLLGSVAFDTSLDITNTNSAGIGYHAPDSFPFSGKIDEPKIYPYARTADQIRQDYNAGLAGISATKGSSATFGDGSEKWMIDGLVGYWKMDESSWTGTSGEVKDASGNNNNGTAVNGATTGIGKFGSGGSFDGSNDYVSTTVTGARSSVVSVSTWIKPNSTMTTRQDFIESGSSATYATNNWIFSVKGNTGSTAGLSVLGYSSSGSSNLSTVGGILVQNSWNHVVFTSDGSIVKIYINGVLSTSGSITINGNNATGEFIGSGSGGTNPFNGSIDEARIYNRALSADEVEKLYRWAPGPVAQYKFDEGTMLEGDRLAFDAPLTHTLELAKGVGGPTFSRSDGANGVATVTDFEGLVRPVKNGEARFEGARRVENGLAYSEDFSNAAWSKNGNGSYYLSTVTPNTVIAPDDSVTGDTFTVYPALVGSFSIGQRISALPSTTYIYSVYVKNGTIDNSNGGLSLWATTYNSGTMVRNSISSVSIQSNISAGSWTRVSIAATTASSGENQIFFQLGSGYDHRGQTFYVWGAQIENVTGQSNQNPSEYVSTGVKTSAPYHGANVDGVQYFNTYNGNTVSSNVVTESTGASIPDATLHGYVAEGTRGNLATYSEQFDSWSQSGTSVTTANTTISPGGTMTADTLTDDNASAYESVSGSTITVPNDSSTYTFSFYVKKTSGATARMGVNMGFSGGTTISTTPRLNSDTGVASGGTVLDIGNWWRWSISFANNASGNTTFSYTLYPAAAGISSGDSTTNVGSIIVWGAQLEQAFFASSYMPTTSAAVTRGNDSLTYPTSGNVKTDAITAYMETNIPRPSSGGVWRGIVNNYYSASSNPLSFRYQSNETNILDRSSASAIAKHALRYSSSGMAIAVNGSFTSNVLTSNVFTGSLLYIGSNSGYSPMDGTIRKVKILKEALTDMQLQSATSSTTVDSSGNSNTGTLVGAPTWTEGKEGKAMVFDGVDDAVNAGTALGNFGTNDFSVSAWVKTSFSASREYIISKRSGTGYGNFWEMRVESNVLQSSIDGGDVNSYAGATGTITINDGNWHFVSMIRSGSTVTQYVDGKKDGTGTATNLPNVSNAGTLYVGQSTYTTNWNGSLDDVRIYNYARTQEQILEDMNFGAPANRNPVAYYKFDEGNGTTVNNSGIEGSALNGTLTNMAAPATTISGWTNDGKRGKALNFDGSDDYMLSGQRIFSGNTTISAWFKPRSFTSNWAGVGTFQYKSGVNGTGWQITPLATGVKVVVGRTGANYTTNIFPATIPTNSWSHIVATYSDGIFRVYLNGKKIGSDWSQAVVYEITGDKIHIGRWAWDYNGYYFDGFIDETKIYSFDLTEDEIKAEYNVGSSTVQGESKSISVGGPATGAHARYCPPGNTEGNCAGGSDPSPVGEWTFDEGTGATAKDTSGKNNTGTLTNGPMWDVGKMGNDVKLDGTNDYVSITRLTGLSTGLTLSAWVKTTSSDSSAVYAGNAAQNVFGDTTGSVGMGFGVHGGKVRYNQYTGSWQNFTGNISVNDGKWHYIAVSHSQSGAFVMYVDGNADITGTVSINGSSAVDVIGRGYSADYFTGDLDDARVYSYARTPAQIAWDYNRGGPVGRWKMDECQGTTLYDASGNGNNGTWNGTSGGSQTSVGTCQTASTAWGNGATGKFNASLNFDGTDDWVSASGTSQLNISKDISISAWVKGSGMFLSNGTLYGAFIDTNRVRYWYWGQATGGWLNFSTNVGTIVPGKWSHVVIENIPGNISGWSVPKIYIDGVEQIVTGNT